MVRRGSDREIIENHLDRAIVGRDRITITLRSGDVGGRSEAIRTMLRRSRSPSRRPFRCARESRIRHRAARRSTRRRDRRCLTAIARSRAWVDAIVKDPATDIGTIAKRENLAERHVRFLMPLAYLSPRIIEAIAEGRVPANLTVTRLVRNLPTVWADQEKQLGFA